MIVPDATPNRTRLTILGLAFVSFHLAGWLFPDTWWGTHFLAFLPLLWSCLFVVLVLAILFSAENLPIGRSSLTDSRRFPRLVGGLLLPVLMASAVSLAFYRFPLAMDAFGDAIRFEQYFREPRSEFKPEYVRVMLDWNIFHARNGERTVLNAMHFLAAQSGRPPREMFRLMTALCGGMYVLFSLWFVRAYGGLLLQKTVYLCLLLLVPFLWMFFGHMEIYAPAILLATAYGGALLLFLRKPSYLWLPGLLLLLYLSIKAHTVNFLLAPSFLLALAWYVFRKSGRFTDSFNWRKTGLLLIILYVILGAVLYFLVLEDFKDTRVPGEHPNRYFLPLLSPEPPLDRYTLLSAAHLFDFLNMLLLMSGAAVFVIATSFLFFRRRIRWDSPDVIITGLTTVLYLFFYFALNPLLGMPLDADLFSLPAPFLILFSITLVRQLRDSGTLRRLWGPVLALSLFTLPMLAVNARAGLLVHRLESVGVRTFRTYWIGAGQPLWVSLSASSRSPEQFETRVNNVLPRLRPYAIQGSDVEYAEILRRIGKRFRERFQQPEKALTYHEQAFGYDAGNRVNVLNLMDAYYLVGQFDEAYKTSQYLIAFRFPEYREALGRAIRCAVMAGKYEEARMHAQEYGEHWPNDQTMSPILERLQEDKPH